MRSAVEREVRIGAWRAFLGIKQELEAFQGSVGEEGPLKQDDLPQAPPRPDGGCCLCGSADQRETGFWDWDQILRYESSSLKLYKELSSSIFQSCQSVSQSVRHA